MMTYIHLLHGRCDHCKKLAALALEVSEVIPRHWAFLCGECTADSEQSWEDNNRLEACHDHQGRNIHAATSR